MMLIRDVCRVFAVLLAIGSCTLVAAERSPAQAQRPDTRQQVEEQFREWLAGTVWPGAQKQGTSPETFDRAFATATLDWKLPELRPSSSSALGDEQRQAGKLSEPAVVKQALDILSGKAMAKRGMWNRRSNDFQERIGTGQLTALAEVLRDLNRGSEQQEASYSEQQIFEGALDFMIREVAASSRLTETEARKLIEQSLAKATHFNKAEIATAEPNEPDYEAAA